MRRQLWTIFIGGLMVTTTACSSGGGGETANQEKPETKDGKTVVTLSIQEPSPFYQIIEKKFEEKYPDLDLQIQAYKQTGEEWGPGDFEKYNKTTNTALLSGKGADVIELNSLPVDDYVNKQLLLNMDTFLEQDKTLNASDLQMNILKALKLNGGTYVMPSGFFLRVFAGDGDILKNTSIDDKNWTWMEFKEISKKLMQNTGEGSQEPRYALANNPPEVLLQEMLIDDYSRLVDLEARKAKFDTPLFVEMMQQVQKMYEDKVITSEQAENGKQLFYSTVLFSPADFVNGLYVLFNNPKLLQKPHSGQTGGPRIVPASQFGIQAKSPVKEQAWKFIAFLLSDEVQSIQEREGFSLRQSVNEKKLDDIQKEIKGGTFKLPNGNAVKVTDEEFTQFKELIQTADQYSVLHGKVISIVGDESRSFFSGQKSAEEVAKLIQNRSTTYLNE